ncbi:MAG: sigma 54-interacting transcriptional regulator [Deltaproteobacteria bacterium]|nr:sigma 54-interacting transcriptional regulator [Deltaproteobacteria bacterium]
MGALLESELFGCRKSAFSEAKKGQTLAFCGTARGTLFLDGNR